MSARYPSDTPHLDSNLQHDEIITAIELPPKGFAHSYTYLKIRDRLSYAFALVSVAVGLDLEGNKIKEARLALGGVAHKPWRNPEAEAALRGQPADSNAYAKAAEILLRGVGQESLPLGIDGPELGEVLHEDPEGRAIAAHHRDGVLNRRHAAKLGEFVQHENDRQL